ncbi:MAG: hypothetical protein ABIP44_09235 [Pseudoxanthomonas sp.]
MPRFSEAVPRPLDGALADDRARLGAANVNGCVITGAAREYVRRTRRNRPDQIGAMAPPNFVFLIKA